MHRMKRKRHLTIQGPAVLYLNKIDRRDCQWGSNRSSGICRRRAGRIVIPLPNKTGVARDENRWWWIPKEIGEVFSRAGSTSRQWHDSITRLIPEKRKGISPTDDRGGEIRRSQRVKVTSFQKRTEISSLVHVTSWHLVLTQPIISCNSIGFLGIG